MYPPCTSIDDFDRFCGLSRFLFSIAYILSTSGLGSIPTRASSNSSEKIGARAVREFLCDLRGLLQFHRFSAVALVGS